MDYAQMTAPCGLDCFNCTFYLAHDSEEAMQQLEQWSEQHKVPVEVMLCKGCRDHDGRIPLQMHVFGDEHRCAAYECAKEKDAQFCCDCSEFPCDNLHPYADRAAELPHNIKVFNLCMIKKMGLESWAETKAAKVRETYFNKPWSLS
jgi:hypothetical protein